MSVRSEVDRLHGVDIKSDSPVLTWLVEHAANAIKIGPSGPGGRPALELRRRRPFRKPVVTSSEEVLLLPGGKREPKMQDFKRQDSTQERFYDDRTGFELNPDLVRQAGASRWGSWASLRCGTLSRWPIV
jgi:hypothetical protein